MIVDQNISVKTNSNTYKYYQSLGYNFNCGDIITINIDDLPKGSHVKINCKCEICGNIVLVSYKNYNLQFSKNSFYCCSKCRYRKTEITMMKLYGVNHFNNKDKSKETCINKYGVSSYSKTKDFKNKCRLTTFKNYGVDNPSKSLEIKDKKKKTFLKNYGVDSFFKTKEFKDYVKKMFLERYGVDNPFKSKEIIDTIKKRNIESGFWVSDNKYKTYRRKVNYLTNKNKIILIKEWDGKDYYDGEYIRDNFSLDKNHNNYPSIDHKMPVIYAYINNITINEVSNIDNLCITKRIINSYKRNILEKEFTNYEYK